MSTVSPESAAPLPAPWEFADDEISRPTSAVAVSLAAIGLTAVLTAACGSGEGHNTAPSTLPAPSNSTETSPSVTPTTIPANRLRIKIGGKVFACTYRRYEVEKGDALTLIAEDHKASGLPEGGTLAGIMQMNHIIVDPGHIETGWQLRLPKACSPAQ